MSSHLICILFLETQTGAAINSKTLAPVVRRLDNAIHQRNRYRVDKSLQNKPRYPLVNDLSGG